MDPERFHEPVVVEQAEFEDLAGIMAVEQCCFGRVWTEQQYATDLVGLTPTFSAVARVGGRVVAYGAISCAGDQGYISTLGVLTEYRELGLGKAVLRLMLRHAKAMGMPEVVLEVRLQNAAARRLYESHGFRSVGMRRNLYTDPPDHGVVMQLWLKGIDEVS